MKITINRRGGFAGTTETVAVKDSTVAAHAPATLASTVERIKRLSQGHNPEGADFVHYDVQIEDAGKRTTVSFADDGSDRARELVGLVNDISAA